MSYLPYQFIICTPEQYQSVQSFGWDFGAPLEGPDGRLMTNLNGNLPFSEEQVEALDEIGISEANGNLVWDDGIAAWKEENNWNEE